MSRRQFALALSALLQATPRRQTAAPAPGTSPAASDKQRAAAMAALAAALRAELTAAGGSWEQWIRRLEPVRARWTQVAGGTKRGRNGYVFNWNGLKYLVDTDLEAGIDGTRPLEVLTAFDRKLKKRGIDLVYVPIPTIEELYPENFLDAPPADLTVQPSMRRFLLSLLERDIETMDLLRPFQAARAGYRLGLKEDDHWNNVEIELAASLVAGRLRRYPFVQAAAAQAKRYTTKAITIDGERGIRAMSQVVTPAGTLYEDVDQSPVLVVGDSNLQIYQYENESLKRTGKHAGFTAHLARHIGLPVSLEATGSFRPADLNRMPDLLEGRRVVVFVGAAWLLSYAPWTAVTA